MAHQVLGSLSRHRMLISIGLLILADISLSATNEQQPQSLNRPWLRPRSRSQPTGSSSTSAPQLLATGTAVELAAPANSAVIQTPIAPVQLPANRSTRTADVFKDGEGYNIFVTNTCERESMKVNIKTSRPFYGVIHTRNQRQKASCSVEGNGDTEYNLEISHILNSLDPTYCGVIKARRDSPDDKDILSVVVAVRVHRNIELSDDKFFLLNCTNRCRKPDCSNPTSNAKLVDPADESNPNGRLTEIEEGERESGSTPTNLSSNSTTKADECTVWNFPWLITLLWCMGILLLAMIISHCIMCSSLVCRCVRTEVEEKEPSIYEGATDLEEEEAYNKKNPYRIDYDNRDIYNTSNNYQPYCLEETQTKSRQKRKKGSARPTENGINSVSGDNHVYIYIEADV